MSILNHEITVFLADIGYFGQTTKQPLSNFEPKRPWKYKKVWGLRSYAICL